MDNTYYANLLTQFRAASEDDKEEILEALCDFESEPRYDTFSPEVITEIIEVLGEEDYWEFWNTPVELYRTLLASLSPAQKQRVLPFVAQNAYLKYDGHDKLVAQLYAEAIEMAKLRDKETLNQVLTHVHETITDYPDIVSEDPGTWEHLWLECLLGLEDLKDDEYFSFFTLYSKDSYDPDYSPNVPNAFQKEYLRCKRGSVEAVRKKQLHRLRDYFFNEFLQDGDGYNVNECLASGTLPRTFLHGCLEDYRREGNDLGVKSCQLLLDARR